MRDSRHRIPVFFVIKQVQKLRAGQFSEHGQRHGVGLGVVVDVDVQSVHHVVVRVGEELFHRRIRDFRRDIHPREDAEV